MSIVIGIFTFVLILVSLFVILVVLAQKGKDGGMGAALGGGATEAAFGADTGNVLTKATINAAIAFFVLSFGLYLGHVYVAKHAKASAGNALPTIQAPAVPAPATTTPTAPVEGAPAPAPTVTVPTVPAPTAETTQPKQP